MTRHLSCCVQGCDSRGSQDDVSFHKFPINVDTWMVRCIHSDGRVEKLRRRKIWEDRLLHGQKAPASYRVCSLHFEDNDFLPTWEGRARKWNHLKKTALPSRNLPPRIAEEKGPSEAVGKVLETELPDGTVCEFFTFEGKAGKDTENTSTATPNSSGTDSYSDDEGSTCDSAVPDCEGAHDAAAAGRKRKASDDPLAQLDGLKSLRKTQVKEETNLKPVKRLRKVDIFDFDGVFEALEKRTVCLPSASWSYSLLNRCILMFLCWDDSLRLTKKAVLRKGSPLELFCDDRLLASRAKLPVSNYDELELALHYLDRYEWCTGSGSEGRSAECDLYTLNGKPRCTACDDRTAEARNYFLVDHPFGGVIMEIPEVVMEDGDGD